MNAFSFQSNALIKKIKNNFLGDNSTIDFRQKHLFIVSFRIALFLLAWLMSFLFYPEIWIYAPVPAILFNVGFFLTAICYWLLLRRKALSSLIFLEILGDVLGQTAVIYVIGLKSTVAFFIYSLYIIGIGSLIGSFAALVTMGVCLFFYFGTNALVGLDLISAFVYPGDAGGWINQPLLRETFSFVFLPFALGFLVYAIHVTNHFFQVKQKDLQRRHVQLTALNNIGSTIRKALNTNNVIHQVLKGVTTGLRFEACLLGLVDKDTRMLRFFVSEENYHVRKMQEILGTRFQEMVLPLSEDKNSNAILLAMGRSRVVIRKNIAELVEGFVPCVNVNHYRAMQAQMGFRKFVITPMVAEKESMGIILGISTSEFIEDTVVDTLDNFSNQAALAIESAQLFEELQKKNEALVQANQVKSDFLAIMSHELRTPLNAVIGFSEILLDDVIGHLNDEQKNSVNEILKSARNLLDLINNILDLAKLEAGKMKLNLSRFLFSDLLHEVEKTVKPLLDKKGQHLLLHLEEKLAPAIADSMKMRQILLNLLSNAIKFTKNGGQIEVGVNFFTKAREVAKEKFPEEHFVLEVLENPAFYIAVKDNGVGIEKEKLIQVFEDFQQIDPTFTRAHEGTGLGLALTKKLVLLHGGVICVESEPQKGSEFRILLPQKILTRRQNQELLSTGS